jgi:hypothetical protein
MAALDPMGAGRIAGVQMIDSIPKQKDLAMSALLI